MEDKKLDKNGLMRVWLKIWTLLKLLVGDVDVDGKGDLQTQIDNLDNRVEECFRNASDGKKLIADAITGRGVATKVSDTFAIMAANIAKIAGAAKLQNKTAVLSNVEQTVKADAGYDGLGQVSVPAVKGTAGAGDVLSGKTFSGAVGVEKAGTMPNKGAWTGDTTDNGTVAIPAGYHNGQGYVSGAGAYAKGMEDADARTNVDSANYRTGYTAGVADTKVGTAVAADVLSGKTFTNSKDVGADGGMANRAAVTVDAGGVSQDDEYTYFTVPSDAFYNANSKLRTKNSNFTPEFELVEGICKPGDVIDLKKQIVAIAIAYNRQSMLVSASFWAVSFGNFYKYPQNTNAIIIDGTKATLTYRGGVAAGGGTGDTDPADYYMALVVK